MGWGKKKSYKQSCELDWRIVMLCVKTDLSFEAALPHQALSPYAQMNPSPAVEFPTPS
jgi:hypothetical protein